MYRLISNPPTYLLHTIRDQRKERAKRYAQGFKEEDRKVILAASPSKRRRGCAAGVLTEPPISVLNQDQRKREQARQTRQMIDQCLDQEVTIIQRLSTLESQETDWRRAQFLRISLYPRSAW